ncbi:MaoC family dehydratase [Streptomyces sp. 15-116A]|uniref:MaoC family dehydratase n=1 Tax=Streptomyces sp. 15-116A TaxID=2259035 RepID=UPI0021B1BE41|nr:MaoC family dehydratase [Streptomyces sp. 15-116A]MCT7355002.1 MaoC family dehydratase [Streptomyces sp. 15-116A]
MTHGRFYDDFELGAVYQHWPGKTVTEYDHHLFCLLTMVRHPIHMDHRFAETATEHGRPLVISSYVFSLLLGLSEPDIAGAALAHRGFGEIRHEAPLFHGDTLYAESKILAKEKPSDKPGRGTVEVETRGVNQHGTEILTFTRRLEVPLGHHPLTQPGSHEAWPFTGETARRLATRDT